MTKQTFHGFVFRDNEWHHFASAPSLAVLRAVAAADGWAEWEYTAW